MTTEPTENRSQMSDTVFVRDFKIVPEDDGSGRVRIYGTDADEYIFLGTAAELRRWVNRRPGPVTGAMVERGVAALQAGGVLASVPLPVGFDLRSFVERLLTAAMGEGET